MLVNALTAHQLRYLETTAESWFLIGQGKGLWLWKEEDISRWRKHIECLIDSCYIMEGMAPPKSHIWFPSPLAATIYLQQMAFPGLHHDLQRPLEISIQLWDLLSEDVYDVISKATFPGMMQGNAIEDVIIEEICRRTSCQFNCNLGSMATSLLAFIEFCEEHIQEIGIRDIIQPCQSWLRLGQAGCGWWWMFEEVVLIAEPFKRIGEALVYPDGFSVPISQQLRETMQSFDCF